MLKRTEGDPLQGRLVYRPGDRALDVEPHSDSGGASLLVNDAQIELDEDSHLLYVWGYCPHESWQASKLELPRSSPGRLSFSGAPIVPGSSARLNHERWPILFDEAAGWLCIGSPGARGDAVEFSPGAIAVLDNGELQALWLHPELLPTNVVP